MFFEVDVDGDGLSLCDEADVMVHELVIVVAVGDEGSRVGGEDVELFLRLGRQ